MLRIFERIRCLRHTDGIPTSQQKRIGPDYGSTSTNATFICIRGSLTGKIVGNASHAVGMTRALDEYLARGSKGILSYVEWNNFASLKSCYRMGYADFGKIYVLRLFGHFISSMPTRAANPTKPA